MAPSPVKCSWTPGYAVVGEHTLQLQGVANDGFIKAANLGVVVQEPVLLTADGARDMLVWIAGLALAAVLAAVFVAIALGRRRRTNREIRLPQPEPQELTFVQ